MNKHIFKASMWRSVKYGIYSLFLAFAVCFIAGVDEKYALAFSICLTLLLLLILPVVYMIWEKVLDDKIKILKAEFGEENPIRNVTVLGRDKKSRKKYRCLMGIGKNRLLAIRRSGKHHDIIRLEKTAPKDIVLYGEWFIIRFKDEKRAAFIFKCKQRFRILGEFVMSGWNVAGMDDAPDN